MKQLCLSILAMLTLASALFAQPNEKTAKEKMAPFQGWIGEWKGEGSMQMGPGAPQKSSVHEKIQLALDGAIVVLEGIGKSTDPATNSEKIVHHAYGIISYDQIANEYKLRSYLSDGRSTDAWFKMITDSQFQWGFDVPNGKIRYAIEIDPKEGTWKESGEYSSDGTQWRKFFSMDLKKVK